jgi:hypothetical protein
MYGDKVNMGTKFKYGIKFIRGQSSNGDKVYMGDVVSKNFFPAILN